MFELRILNGLHRGATLPLEDGRLALGSSEEADVVLVDPGIEATHARILFTEGTWQLQSEEGDVRSAEHNQPVASLSLQAGDFARVGSIWITVTDADAPWSALPPEPTDAPQETQAEASDEMPSVDEEDGPSTEELLGQDTVESNAERAEEAAAVAAAAAAPAPRRSLLKRSPKLLIPIGLVTVLSACAAYKITSSSDPLTTPASLGKLEDSASMSTTAALTAEAANNRTIIKSGASASKPASEMAATLAPSPAPKVDLRAAFRARLKDVDLLKRFELQLDEKNWVMHAELDDDEAARFERVLTQFIKTHNITFPVHAKVGSAEQMLPFKIRQVVSGSNASVITQDGTRLYIGDTYRGVRLVAINGSELRFDGARKIKVKW